MSSAFCPIKNVQNGFGVLWITETRSMRGKADHGALIRVPFCSAFAHNDDRIAPRADAIFPEGIILPPDILPAGQGVRYPVSAERDPTDQLVALRCGDAVPERLRRVLYPGHVGTERRPGHIQKSQFLQRLL